MFRSEAHRSPVETAKGPSGPFAVGEPALYDSAIFTRFYAAGNSWERLRQAMSTQQRVTATMQRRDGRAIHVRKATRADAHHHKINTILGLSPNPGGTHRVIV